MKHAISPSRQLSDAIKNADMAVIQALLEKNPRLQVQIDEQQTQVPPICYAAQLGRLDVIKLLFERNSTCLTDKTDKQMNSFLIAVKENHFDIASWLVGKRKTFLKERDGDNRTALLVAAEVGHVDMLRWLAQEASMSNGSGKKAISDALHWAVKEGYLDIVKALIEDNDCLLTEQVNQYNDDTVIILAANAGYVDVVRWLAQQTGIANGTGKKAAAVILFWAAEEGHLDIVKALIEDNDSLLSEQVNQHSDDTVISLAANAGHADMVRWLVQQRGIANGTGKEAACEALYCAAREGHLDIVKALIKGNDSLLTEQDKHGYTVISKAGINAHVEVIRWLAQQTGVANGTGKEAACEALHWAARTGHLDIVKALIEDNESLLVEDRFGHTVISMAAHVDRAGMVRWLVQQRGMANDSGKKAAAEALFGAANDGYLNIVKVLIEDNESLLVEQDKHGDTAISLAAKRGLVDMVRWLAQQTGVANGAGKKRAVKVLFWAAREGHLDIVKALIKDNESLLTEQDYYHNTVVSLAANAGHVDLVKWLAQQTGIANGTGKKAAAEILFWAAEEGHLDIVKALIEDNDSLLTEQVNQYNDDTVIKLAVYADNVDVIRWLAQQTGVANGTGEKAAGEALVWAAKEGHFDIVKALIKDNESLLTEQVHWAGEISGASRALFLFALEGQHYHVVEWLCQHGDVTLREKNKRGETALHLLAKKGHLASVRWLLDQPGISLADQTNAGATVLHLAAYAGHLKLVTWLVEEKKASLADQTNAGATVLHLAAYGGHLDLVKWLLPQEGVSLGETDKEGDNALLVAARRGHLNVVSHLVETMISSGVTEKEMADAQEFVNVCQADPEKADLVSEMRKVTQVSVILSDHPSDAKKARHSSSSSKGASQSSSGKKERVLSDQPPKKKRTKVGGGKKVDASSMGVFSGSRPGSSREKTGKKRKAPGMTNT